MQALAEEEEAWVCGGAREKEEIQQRVINAEANMSQLDVIRCVKDGCINGGKATGEGRAGKETEARVRETQIGL